MTADFSFLYMWGLPYVLAGRLRDNMTNPVSRGPRSAAAPINEFGHQRLLSDPSYKVGVAPNVDTLYSVAWLDLGAGDFTLRMPDFGDLYYGVQVGFLDTSSVAFGARTHGGQLPPLTIRAAGVRSVTETPSGIEIGVSDRYVMVAVRIRLSGTGDAVLTSARRLQDSIDLAISEHGELQDREPLHGDVRPDLPAGGVPGAVCEEGFFAKLWAELGQLGRDGVPDEVRRRLPLLVSSSVSAAAEGAAAGAREVEARMTSLGHTAGGWSTNWKGCELSDDWLLRAAVAQSQIYINPAEEAVYPVAERDARGDVLDGRNAYLVDFSGSGTPPVQFFWSLTMYHAAGLLVENDLRRYAVGRDGSDGPLDAAVGRVFISHAAPSDPDVTWLPAPPGPFRLMMRLYGPGAAAATGPWSPPAVHRLG